MELRHLRYFVAVAEELHFGRAAERLNISQPPLSQQIKSLEQELGIQLFARTNRKVSLTHVGSVFLSEARATLEKADRATKIAKLAQRGELGELRISMFPSALLLAEVANAVLAYRRAYPDVRLALNELESHQQALALVEEREDVAIVRGIAKPLPSKHLVARQLLKEPLVVAMHSDHPLARSRGALEIASLANEPFVFYGEQMGLTLPRRVRELCSKADFEPRVGQIANANSSMIGLIAAGLGIAIVPRAVCRLAPAEVVTRNLRDGDASVAVWVLHDRRRESSLVDRFLRSMWP